MVGKVRKTENPTHPWEVIDYAEGAPVRLEFKDKKEAQAHAKEVNDATPPGGVPDTVGLDKEPTTKREALGQQFTRWLDPMSEVQGREEYIINRLQAFGEAHESENLAKLVNDAYNAADPSELPEIEEYMNHDIPPDGIIKDKTRNAFIKAKAAIEAHADEAVRTGHLTRETREANRGTYMPTLYLRYILTGRTGIAGGARVSPMGMFKQKITDPEFSQEVKDTLYGEVHNAGYQAAQSIGILGRDQALGRLFERIAKNPNWVLPDSIVDWNGQKVSAIWLDEEAKKVSMIADNQPTDQLRLKSHDKAREMREISGPGLQMRDTKGFSQVPNTRRHGKMAGAWIQKPIYDDLLAGNFKNKEASEAEKWLGTEGKLSRTIPIWKTFKVPLNPMSQFRNMMSNFVLLNLSGVPFRRLGTRLIQSWHEINNNGVHWQYMKKYGGTNTTFSSQELWRINRRFVAIDKEHGGFWANTLDKVKAIAEWAGDKYALVEAWGKTAKVIDEMESHGKTPEQAILAAQDALFDYSLVGPSVRYLRNAVIGIPFLTFQYKVLPVLVKTAIEHPQRFLKYIAIPYIMLALFMRENDVDKEDVEALKESLYTYMRDKGNVYVLPYKDDYGRWQFVDISYYLPWGMYAELVYNIKGLGENVFLNEGDKNIMDVLTTTGVTGGPYTDILVAMSTGIDRFTGRPIMNESDTPGRQWVDWMNYMWRLAAPPWVTNRGAAIKTYDYVTGALDKRTGDPRLTGAQTALRWFGANVQPVDPTMTRMDNLKFMKFEIDKVKRRLRKVLRDKNLTATDRAEIRKEFQDLIKKKLQAMREYAQKTRLHPNLR